VHSAIITNIQNYCIHDGPGIRTTVFFKGCPLACKWCSNPENLSGKPQTGFFETLCAQCGRCAEACPNDAIISGDGLYRIDQSLCIACGRCRDVCWHNALVRYGDTMTVPEVWDVVRRDKMFYDASGGGVTVSGGEPLLSASFVRELFDLCHEDHISTCVETCGCASPEAFLEVLPAADYVLFDLKHMDSEVHRKFIGHRNGRILENAVLVVKSDVDVLFRQPLIPGFNDSRSNIDATVRFLKSFGTKATKLEIMPYHRMGENKYKALDMAYDMAGTAVMNESAIDEIRNEYISRGIDCTVSR
jgi:glycyl-radical enzyme activating protein